MLVNVNYYVFSQILFFKAFTWILYQLRFFFIDDGFNYFQLTNFCRTFLLKNFMLI